MNLEDRVKGRLLGRGFTEKELLNNRGLIGATIDITQNAVVEDLNMNLVTQRSELLSFIKEVAEWDEVYSSTYIKLNARKLIKLNGG